MIRINLLPPSERRSKWPLSRIMLMSGLLIVFCCVSIYSFNIFYTWRLEKEIADMKNQYELLRPTQTVMVSANAKQEALNRKNNILVNLTNSRKQWPPMIAHLAEATTSQIWFTELGVTDKELVKITGLAANYQELAVFLGRLEHDELFAEPALVQAEISPSPAAPAKFEIVLKLKGMK